VLQLAALSTGHKVGLGLVGLAFIVFALVSAFLIPALRPDYPSKRGLPAFLTLSVALFVGMMFAVFFFGREPSESRAEAGSTAETPSASTATPPPPPTTAPSTESRATTPSASVPTTAPTAPKSLSVTESEFKIELPSTSLSPGSYTFDLTNKGQVGHDLVVDGPGVSNEKTPVIGSGKTAKLTVDLKSGKYKLYCSVPGHEQAGMKLEVTVS
jgi:plastocyanin